MKNPPDNSFWTDDRVKLLGRLSDKGLSAAEIAAAIGGCSRNAVIGKIHRLRGGKKVGSSREVTSPKPARATSPPARAAACSTRSPAGKNPAAPRVSIPAVKKEPELQADAITDIPADITTSRVTLLEARDDQCRWPAADDGSATMVCGAAVSSGSWCAVHARRVFQPPRDRVHAAIASEREPLMRRAGRGAR